MKIIKSSPLVLIVDDTIANLQLLGTMLNEEHYNLAIAENGQKALEIAETNLPDLILLDIMMPGMDGYDVCVKLQENPKTKNIPIIFLTAKSEVDDIVKGFTLGAVDYIPKPFHKEELIARVKTHLQLVDSKREIELLNNEKNAFLSRIARDLASPFTSFFGLTDLLANELDRLDKDNLQNIANLLLSNSKLIYSFINNLLDFSQIEVGSMIYEPKKLEPDDFLSNAILNYVNLAKEKDLTIKITKSSQSSIFADNYMLNKILNHLLNNAVKYSKPNGLIELGCDDYNDDVKFYVKDNGIGIEENAKTKLFRLDDIFIQYGTNNEAGLGLGLIICKTLVEIQGGEIWFESTQNQGTTFYFTLPKYKGQNGNTIH
jgi:signal transduction histidine kinase